MHPSMTKMCENLKEFFKWIGLKRDVADFVTSFLTCQKAKVAHPRPGILLQLLDIPKWKWDSK